MTARNISNELVDAMWEGTKDVATLRKIKQMGDRLAERIQQYAKEKCEEQRKLFHDGVNKRVTFNNENDSANFIIEVMKETEYPKFD